jgi:hypothetical protein
MLAGTICIALSASRMAVVQDLSPGGVLFEFANWLAGTVLLWWGWLRLRQARASCSELSWVRFLSTDLIVIGVVAMMLTAAATIPQEQRRVIDQFMHDFAHNLAEVWRTAEGLP